MATLIQFRRGTAAQWTSANPVLHDGEVGFETDDGQFKIGDGSTHWVDLSYASILPSALGANGGIATLDMSGKLNINQLPPIAEVTVHAVANVTERNNLTNVQPGDIAIVSATGDTYVLTATPPSTGSNWSKITVADPFPDHTTTDLAEGTNLYYTSERANNDVADQIAQAISNSALTSTDDLSEGTSHLYFTNQRALNATASAYDATGAASAAQTNAATYTDGTISTEVTNRNTAITDAISSEVTNRNTAITSAVSSAESYTDSAISTEVTNRNSAINTAKGQAISTSEGYTDTAIGTEVTNRNSAIATAKSEATNSFINRVIASGARARNLGTHQNVRKNKLPVKNIKKESGTTMRFAKRESGVTI